MLLQYIEAPPGAIIGPIAYVFGVVIDFLYNVVSFFNIPFALGFAIILMTIVFKVAMIPSTVKTHKSMLKMRLLNPEVEKIKEKYGGTKDPELNRKMNAEIQTLYSKNKANPLGGCLPLLITMPFFFGINYIMRQSFLFIGSIKDIYDNIAVKMMEVPNFTEIISPIANFLRNNNEKITLYADNTTDVSRIINKMTPEHWATFYEKIPVGSAEIIRQAVEVKDKAEMFFGLNLVQNAGWVMPGIIIVILDRKSTRLNSSHT